MLKKVYQIFFLLIFGIIGGIFWQSVLLPYLADITYFENVWFIKDFKERNIILYPTQRVIIQENQVLTETAQRVEKSVVAIRTTTKNGLVLEGSGLILTSDGLMVTLADLLPRGSAFSFWVDGEKLKYEILKRDLTNNLALVRLNKSGLATVPFASLAKIENGQRVFLLGKIFLQGKPTPLVNEGVVKYFDNDFIRSNIYEKKTLKGSVLFDIEGGVLGINKIGLDNEVLTIPISVIKGFASL
jgi:S1-C subfamily serine protease